jgi:large subunit ribosomal protein L24
MQQSFHVKKGDRVYVVTGKDKGKTGEILRVDRKNSRIVVKGINMVKRHTRASVSTAGGIISKESSIHISNVMHIDPTSNAPTRIGRRIEKDGTKVRYAKKSGKIIDK